MGCCDGRWSRYWNGAIHLAGAIAGVNIADPQTIEARRRICLACEHRIGERRRPVMSQCRLCSCFIAAKTRLADERCPAGKWD